MSPFAMGPADGEPLLRALGEAAPPLPLHLPCHGRGRSLAPGLRRLLRLAPGAWDLPELPSIGAPLVEEGAVAESQARSASLLGAERCWYGVHGASGLLQAALLALAPPGTRVLLPRNLHRSLLHGCVLGQIEPLLYDLPFDPLTGLWLPPDPQHLQRVLAAARALGGAAGLVLLDPTYQGLVADLPALIGLAHAQGLPVLVDQAHGSGTAVAAGADLCVLSPQKNATGLAQSAVLLAQGSRVPVAAIERSLLWMQTSSPSALLLAASAAAIDHAHSPAGHRQLERAQRRGLALRQRLQDLDLPLVANGDPLRLVLATAPLGISGLAADAWLLERGVVAELPEPGALTFCLGLDPPRCLERLLPRRLLALRQALGGAPLPPFMPPPLPLLAAPELPLGQAWRAASTPVPLAAAAGRIAAEPLCPYPPGIPLLVPGERIDPARALWLAQQQQLWPGQLPISVQVVDG
jgi:lysine decarboxylase